MVALPCKCVVPLSCLINTFNKADASGIMCGFELCPISNVHQTYNQVQLGLIRMLDLKTKLCDTSLHPNESDDYGMPKHPSFELRVDQNLN